MSAKEKSVFVCSECGYESPKWAGKCPQCGEWNTLNEEVVSRSQTFGAANKSASSLKIERAVPITEISTTDEFRYKTGIRELDRVLGGGLVKGSVVLLSGDPGIGKSTLLMQICNVLTRGNKVLYVSGEESAKQLKLRADRLGISSENLLVLSETNIENVSNYIYSEKTDIVMIDSIQTMNFSELNSTSGSVSQVRECTNILLRAGKSLDIPIIIVGHVNKDGVIAGPKVMEHIVDAVLYFEGERNYSYRILRAVKNRFGSTNEIGVFEMFEDGLHEVENPSMMLISGRIKNVSGNCVACVLEGSRPILAEVQGLVTSTGFGNPRRMATGFDYNRFNLILAVLEKRMGFYYSNSDAYLNIIGGLKLDEPAADLAVALSLVSGLKDVPIPDDMVAFGEIGLSGEVRTVPRVLSRINEIARLGFTQCVVPYSSLKQLNGKIPDNISVMGVKNIREAINAVF